MGDDGDSGFVPLPALELTGEPPGKTQAVARAATRAKYGKTILEYVGAFGLGAGSERTLKRYVAAGRKKDPVDLPPFDEPHLLAAWWRRTMKNKVPDWMVLREQVGAVEEKKDEKGEVHEDLPPAFDMMGLAADAGDAEKELWVMANGFRTEMEIARKNRMSDRWWRAYNEYKKLIEELRKWEKDRSTKRLQRGEVMETAVVVESLTRIFGSVSQTFTGCLFDLAKQLRPDLEASEAMAIVYPMRDKVFAALKESKFAEAAA
jgi:hypothetical protein